jgi:hypothetical protein
VGSSWQLWIRGTKRSKLYEPRQQRWRPMRMSTIENILSIWLPSMLKLLWLNKQLSKIALHVLTTKKKGLPLLPRAHQMCESMTIPTEPTFTHIIFK